MSKNIFVLYIKNKEMFKSLVNLIGLGTRQPYHPIGVQIYKKILISSKKYNFLRKKIFTFEK